jgi:ATP-dependent Clp protease adaptor protein ClpS
MRVDADLASLLQAARDVATRYGHPSTAAEHVLLAYAESPDGIALSESAIHIEELVRLLKARLSTNQAVTGYRGGEARGIDARDALGRIRSARGLWQRLFKPLTATEVVDTLLTQELAPVAEASRFDLAEVLAFHDDALAEARRRWHLDVGWEHALFVAFGRKSLRAPLEAAGVDASAVCTALDRLLRASGPIALRLPDCEKLVTLACVHANTSGKTLSIAPLAVLVLRHRTIVRGLAAGRVDPFDVIYALAHGRPLATDHDVSGEVDVVFFDDQYTTQEFVVKVLTSVFELPADRAQDLMMRVHQSGSGRVGPFRADDARERLAKVRAMAEKALIPLRLEAAPSKQS